MAGLSPSPGWQSRVGSALVVLLTVAVGARAIWYLLAPIVPALTVLALLFGLTVLLFRRRH